MFAGSSGQVLVPLYKALMKHIEVTLLAVIAKRIQERQLKLK